MSSPTINPMRRVDSISSFFFNGTQGPSFIMEQCTNAHIKKNRDVEVENGLRRSIHSGLHSYGSATKTNEKCIRFQVIIWSAGPVDVLNGRVTMKFRVTLFWNNDSPDLSTKEKTRSQTGKESSFWVMKDRARAYQRQMSELSCKFIDVPQLSILNAVTFDIIGAPEITCLSEEKKLMRWSCLYRAELLQDNMSVHSFPHDEHDLTIKLGIISKREVGDRWDRRKWKLALATEKDSQKTISVPYGVIVDHVEIPCFSYRKEGLQFELTPLTYGLEEKTGDDQDVFLEVKIPVVRDSGYYDCNIIPLLFTLNTVAITFLAMDAEHYFQRTLMTLNVAFVEIGLRMSIDKDLPSVGYQIKLQSIQNRFFYALLYLALESSTVYFLFTYCDVSLDTTRKIDLLAALTALLDLMMISIVYYTGFSNESCLFTNTQT